MTEPATPCHSPRIGKRETQLLKLTADRPFADPDKAARRLLEHARAFEPIQDGRIYIEKLNGPFLFIDKATPAEYTAGLELAISRGWLKLHESGTFVKLTQSGVPVFQN
jgi:hypothetical protein